MGKSLSLHGNKSKQSEESEPTLSGPRIWEPALPPSSYQASPSSYPAHQLQGITPAADHLSVPCSTRVSPSAGPGPSGKPRHHSSSKVKGKPPSIPPPSLLGNLMVTQMCLKDTRRKLLMPGPKSAFSTQVPPLTSLSWPENWKPSTVPFLPSPFPPQTTARTRSFLHPHPHPDPDIPPQHQIPAPFSNLSHQPPPKACPQLCTKTRANSKRSALALQAPTCLPLPPCSIPGRPY